MSIKRENKMSLTSRTIDIHAEFYDNASEVVADCKSRPVRINGYEVEEKCDKSFTGVATYSEALDLMKNGYQPSVESFRKELKATGTMSPRFTFTNNVYGFAPIVANYLQGIPNCMVNMTMKPMKQKVLDIYYDMGVIASVSTDQIIKAGQAVLGSILELERQGYRFNLYAVQSYYGESQKALDILCVKVKSSNTLLDLKRMSYPLTHPSFFRVIGFDWQGKSPVTRYIGGGRGTDLVRKVSPEEANATFKSVFGSNSCYISASDIVKSNFDREKLKGVYINATPKK